jgi:hypothetical protein
MNSRNTENIIIEIPPNAIHIQNAKCSHGHSLMDKDFLLSNIPSIKLIAECQGKRGVIRLNAYYGNFELLSEIPLAEGDIVSLTCPECHVSLRHESDLCALCNSPMFILHLPKGGFLEGCMKKGCYNHKLKIVDLDTQILEEIKKDLRMMM